MCVGGGILRASALYDHKLLKSTLNGPDSILGVLGGGSKVHEGSPQGVGSAGHFLLIVRVCERLGMRLLAVEACGCRSVESIRRRYSCSRP